MSDNTTEEKNLAQPLDTLMTQLGVSNADLVKASTEQLTFKTVQKGRRGRPLSKNVQQKILNALQTVKPDLAVRRRELFRYDPGESVTAKILKALDGVRAKKISYPQFIDCLAEAGMTYYAVDVGANQITFYGVLGVAHVEKGPVISQGIPGLYNVAALGSAIKAAQGEKIDHPTFLKRIHDAGIVVYEVNIRNREIRYKGESESYKETIPLPGEVPAARPPQKARPSAPQTEDPVKPAKPGQTKKAVKMMKKNKKWKRVKLHRVKTYRFMRTR